MRSLYSPASRQADATAASSNQSGSLNPLFPLLTKPAMASFISPEDNKSATGTASTSGAEDKTATASGCCKIAAMFSV
ncbi:hypothetical protein DL95DRAFT_386389 [Leptodontidium sp. 2 PMI_412]|nr:hypothetical protein DL95DRAFT_386389 [Leptodontidium sp. 2 PMI_412]